MCINREIDTAVELKEPRRVFVDDDDLLGASPARGVRFVDHCSRTERVGCVRSTQIVRVQHDRVGAIHAVERVDAIDHNR